MDKSETTVEQSGIREALERANGPLLDSVWDELMEDQYIEMHQSGTLVVDDPDASWEDLKKEAKKRQERVEKHVSKYLEQAGQKDASSRSRAGGRWKWIRERSFRQSEEVGTVGEAVTRDVWSMDPESTQMLLATSEYFEHKANRHPAVRQFRDEVLEGNLLTRDQAIRLLSSYTARFLPWEWFVKEGVSVVGYTSDIVGGYEESLEGDTVDHRVSIRVDPPGSTLRLRYARPHTISLAMEEAITRCEVRGGEIITPYKLELPVDTENETRQISTSTPEPNNNMGPALMGGFDTATRPHNVWPGSLVDDIYVLSEELAHMYKWPPRFAKTAGLRLWSKDVAAEFLLTGTAPLTRPLEAESILVCGQGAPSRWEIRLNVSPSVSPNEVRQAYKKLQEAILGTRFKSLDPKTFEVARFVLQRTKLNDEVPQWLHLRREWNKEHPDAPFTSNSNLQEYVSRALAAIEKRNFHYDDDEQPYA